MYIPYVPYHATLHIQYVLYDIYYKKNNSMFALVAQLLVVVNNVATKRNGIRLHRRDGAGARVVIT